MHLALSKRTIVHCALGAALSAGAALAASCAKGSPGSVYNTSGTNPGSGTGTSLTSGTSIAVSQDGSIGIISTNCSSGMCTDFADACSLVDDAGTCSQGGSASVIVDPTWPAADTPSQIFGSPGGTVQSGTGGPCLYEPASGALFPNNWLRPRFLWTAPSGQGLFELHFHSSAESTDLFVYTADTKWTMPKDLWTSLAGNVQDTLITVGIRGASAGGSPSSGTETSFAIAPAPAQGAMVFWSTASFSTSATTTNLQGFTVGDETTVTVLKPYPQVTQMVLADNPDGGNLSTVPQPVTCIGCHTATPDGLYVGFTAQWPWPNVIATVAPDAGTPVGAPPPWLAPGAIANLSPNIGNSMTPSGFYLGGSAVDNAAGLTATANNVDNVMLGIQTFSAAHYQTGDRIEITSLGASLDDPDNSAGQPEGTQATGVVSQLIWVDLEFANASDAGRPNAAMGATSNGGWGVLNRGNDSTNSAGSPSWSHDGNTIAYTSSNEGTMDGRLDQPKAGTNADVMTVPYGANPAGTPGGTGGSATPVPGASSSSLNEYFPSWSPDDKFLAFNAVPSQDTMYDQPAAEVFVVPAPGNTATCAGGTQPPCKLAANAPAACTGLATPGVQNTWPKWAPAQAGGVAPSSDMNTYYWVTFSSIRINDPKSAASTGSAQMDGGGPAGKVQLYIAGVSVSPSGAISTYPAVYLWNQDPTVNNLIPAWDNFTLPPAVGGQPR